MRTFGFLLRVVMPVAIGALACVSAGQGAFNNWTAEAMAARSKMIFRGVVVQVTQSPKLMLTIHVDEVIKGSPGKTFTLEPRENSERFRRYQLWRRSQAEFLWFVYVPETPSYEPWDSIRLGPSDPEDTHAKFRDESITTGTFGMDFRPFKSPWDLLERVRSFVALWPGIEEVSTVSIPKSLGSLIGRGFDSQRLILPINKELEANVIALLKTPESVLPVLHEKYDGLWIRYDCIRLLSSFKSDGNIELLKPYLSEPSGTREYSTPFTPNQTYYWLRLAAYEVLTHWGVQVPKPNLDGP